MKQTGKIVWGVLLVVLGGIFALNALGITRITVFFKGWWTLFLIVPSFIGLLTKREKTGNAIGLLLGIVLLLACQGVIRFSLLWKLVAPAVIVLIGVKLLFSGLRGNKSRGLLSAWKERGGAPRSACAIFAGYRLSPDGELFEGAELTAVFGGLECDLCKALIPKDCAVSVCAVFGGIDLFIPEGVNVKVEATCLFGGVSNKTAYIPDAPTLYVSGLCMFGGVEIK